MKRFGWIDIAKGLGIIFVTLLHTRLFETGFGAWASSFHMPNFFSPVLQWLGRNSLTIFCLHGACGVCAHTWGGGVVPKICEYILMAILVGLLSGPLKWMWLLPKRKGG